MDSKSSLAIGVEDLLEGNSIQELSSIKAGKSIKSVCVLSSEDTKSGVQNLDAKSENTYFKASINSRDVLVA